MSHADSRNILCALICFLGCKSLPGVIHSCSLGTANPLCSQICITSRTEETSTVGMSQVSPWSAKYKEDARVSVLSPEYRDDMGKCTPEYSDDCGEFIGNGHWGESCTWGCKTGRTCSISAAGSSASCPCISWGSNHDGLIIGPEGIINLVPSGGS